MKITFGEKGLTKSWQAEFKPETKCCRCGGTARIGFVAHEDRDENIPFEKRLCGMYENKGKGNYWLHDCVAVAVYFCKDCLETTALYNQG